MLSSFLSDQTPRGRSPTEAPRAAPARVHCDRSEHAIGKGVRLTLTPFGVPLEQLSRQGLLFDDQAIRLG